MASMTTSRTLPHRRMLRALLGFGMLAAPALTACTGVSHPREDYLRSRSLTLSPSGDSGWVARASDSKSAPDAFGRLAALARSSLGTPAMLSPLKNDGLALADATFVRDGSVLSDTPRGDIIGR